MYYNRCQSLTGHGGSVTSAAMEDNHQRKIVKLFQKGKVNLLICTSVAEEGLDITQCSLVVRFDLPLTEAAYIQSRGRARKPESMYVMFHELGNKQELEYVDGLSKAENYMRHFAQERKKAEGAEAGDDDEDIFRLNFYFKFDILCDCW